MVYSFPNTAGLERAKSDPLEPIYPGSVGANKLFHILRTTAGFLESPRWDLYLINVYTLLRNAYSKGITQPEIEKIIDTDVDLFMTFVGAYMSFKRQTPANILFYAPDYRAIPGEVLRPTMGNRVEQDARYLKLIQKIPKKLTCLTEDHLVGKYIIATSGVQFPHKELPDHIRMIYGGSRSSGSIGTALISHCALDLHLQSSIPSLELFESYTGMILQTTSFGRKLTKDVGLPFNTATHRVFGDDVHLAPLLKGKQKTELIELATKRHWAVKTEREISYDITSTFPSISMSDLTRLRL